MLITPTRQAFVEMRPADVVAIGLNGKRIVAGRGEPSIEWPLHAAIYRARPDVSAIVHTHSPYATARSFDPAPIIVRTEERVYLDLTEVAVARMLTAGSEALATETVAALGSRFAVLLARHGVVAVGTTLDGALEMCSTVEHQAQIDWLLT